MTCPDQQRWVAFLRGGVAAVELDNLDRHLDECGSCRQLLTASGRTSLVRSADGRGAPEPQTPSDAPLQRGDRVGRYVVIDRVGAGAMGAVYAAYDPELDRKVALKLLHGSASPTGLRLLREARALARLAHPHVVGVHDVGTVGERVFIVMEFVAGATLAEWLRQPRPWRAVLEKLVQAGEGLAAAHRAGLVHQDFKPANVMLRRDGRVAVLDFGLAHAAGASPALGAPLAATLAPAETTLEGCRNMLDSPRAKPLSLRTSCSTFAGTPAYMAPEQLDGQVADPLADQFSFCVVLYEALYRRHPFSDRSDEIATLPAHEQVRPPPASDVPGWILSLLQRGLSVDRAERHPSMDALLAALLRDPARRRRRVQIAAAGLLLLAIGGFAGQRLVTREARLCGGADARLAGIWDVVRREQIQRAFAATKKGYAQDSFARVRATLDGYASAWTSMHGEACAATRVRGEQSGALLDLRMQCLSQRLQGMRAVTGLLVQVDAASLPRAIDLARSLPALEPCADARELEARVPRPADPAKRKQLDELEARLADIVAGAVAGRFTAELPLTHQLVDDAHQLGYRPFEAAALDSLGRLQTALSDFKGGEATLQAAVLAAVAGGDDATAAKAWLGLVYAAQRQDHFDEADAYSRHARALVERLGDDAKLASELEYVVAMVRWTQARFDEAQRHIEEAIAITRRRLGSEYRSLPSIVDLQARIERARGNRERALALHLESEALRTRLYGPDHPDLASSLEGRALVLTELGRMDEVRRLFERVIEIRQNAFGPNSQSLGNALNNLGGLLVDQERYAEGVPYLERALAVYERSTGPDHPFVAATLANLGRAATGQGQLARAHTLLDRSLAIRLRRLGATHPSVASSFYKLGLLAEAEGHDTLALAQFRRAATIWEPYRGEKAQLAQALSAAAGCLVRLGSSASAVSTAERALQLLAAEPGTELEQAGAEFALAQALWSAGGDRARARDLATRSRARYLQAHGLMREQAAVEAWLAAPGHRTRRQ